MLLDVGQLSHYVCSFRNNGREGDEVVAKFGSGLGQLVVLGSSVKPAASPGIQHW